MGLFRRTQEAQVSAARRTAERRVAHMSTAQIKTWSEQCLYSIGRALSDYSEDLNGDLLLEAKMAVETLDVLVTALQDTMRTGQHRGY